MTPTRACPMPSTAKTMAKNSIRRLTGVSCASYPCHPERSEGPFLWPQRSLAALGMTPRTASHDLAVVALPVAVAQQALVELARGMARQLGLEIDGARALDGREVLLAE